MSVPTVGLAPERFQQLKILADRDGRTMADTIARFLDACVAAGAIPDQLPGWTIEHQGDHVLLAHADSGLAKKLDPVDAQDVGKRLIAISEPVARCGPYLSIDAMVELRRQGTGVIIIDAFTRSKRTVAANVGADIGRRLIRAAQ